MCNLRIYLIIIIILILVIVFEFLIEKNLEIDLQKELE